MEEKNFYFLKNNHLYYVLRLKGNIVSVDQCVKVSRILKDLISRGQMFLALDFKEVPYVTGSFAGFLVESIKKINKKDGNIMFYNVNDTVAEVFEKVTLSGYIEEEALIANA
jgi:anti-anti-sigma regulatory factor